MTLSPARAIPLSGLCLLALVLLVAPARPAAAGDAPACDTCGNSGRVDCKRCGGDGEIDDAQVPCPKCEGEKVIPCTRCNDDGILECPKCNGGGRIRNPEHKKWKAASHWKSKRDRGEEPPKYIDCPVCKGEGKLECPFCKGTKERECPECDGKGTVTGEGKCPDCGGSGKGPCPDCAVLGEGAPEEASAKLDALENAREVLGEETYWQRRRALVAEANAGLPEEGEEGEDTAGTDAAPDGEVDEATLAERRDALKGLLQAVAAGAIPFDIYEQKRNTLGLSREQIEAVERELGAADDFVKGYLDARERFRAGELTRDGYEAALADLTGA
jgi:hypothetical protein